MERFCFEALRLIILALAIGVGIGVWEYAAQGWIISGVVSAVAFIITSAVLRVLSIVVLDIAFSKIYRDLVITTFKQFWHDCRIVIPAIGLGLGLLYFLSLWGAAATMILSYILMLVVCYGYWYLVVGTQAVYVSGYMHSIGTIKNEK